METYFLIGRILLSKKQIVRSVLSFTAALLITLFIAVSFTDMYADYSYFVLPFRKAEYDAELQSTTKKDFSEQFTMSNIKKCAALNGSIIQPQFRNGDITYFSHIDPY